jgi:NADH-quinone oxidoreductase subunit J
MNLAFYLAGGVAVIATALAITRLNAIHALLYMITSLISIAVVFFVLGAPFVAALEVIIYAGAIVVLFLFVVMMLNLTAGYTPSERQLFSGRAWIGPAVLASILVGEMIFLLARGEGLATGAGLIEPQQVSVGLYGPYLLGVELAGFLLLAGLVGAYHLGKRGRI